MNKLNKFFGNIYKYVFVLIFMSKKKGVMFLCFLSIIILVSGGVLAWSWPWSSVGNVVNEDSCIDSDGGKDYYERGEISDSNGDIVFGDGCIEGDGFNDGWLRETYCDESGPHFFDYECKGGCEDGACIEDDSGSDSSCTDSDNDLDFYSKNYVSITANDEKFEVFDSCMDVVDRENCDTVSCESFVVNSCSDENCFVKEAACDISGLGLRYIPSYCKGGCEDGACIEDDSGSDSSCTDLGYRKAGYYCSEEGFVLQKNVDISCENNFECTSNICLSGECVSEGLIKKVLNWFKNLFA